MELLLPLEEEEEEEMGEEEGDVFGDALSEDAMVSFSLVAEVF